MWTFPFYHRKHFIHRKTLTWLLITYCRGKRGQCRKEINCLFINPIGFDEVLSDKSF